jgi:hydroxyethylthiazole kinase-like uncharacterized protein yjeF
MYTDINIPHTFSLRFQLARRLDAHKGDSGQVRLIGGDMGMVGAVLLAGQAALLAGAGYVRLGFLSPQAPCVSERYPELMCHQASQFQWPWQEKEQKRGQWQAQGQVLAIGPGMGVSQAAADLLAMGLQQTQPLILDADALNLLAVHPALHQVLQRRPYPTVLTPHPGEAARLLQCSVAQVQQDRVGALQRLLTWMQVSPNDSAHHNVVVLKGHGTLIGTLGNTPQRCTAGNAGMAVAGMGDTLTGVMAALIAQGGRLSIKEAICLAVVFHACAADRLVKPGKNSARYVGPLGLTPSEVAFEIRHLLNAPDEVISEIFRN